ncbi:NACHT domain-containing protein [Dactylosporangium sp. NPDC049140]|uniref:NACHT domain-containing protein n=1 Tax=Dactylosporangium sp. NPDC049140 TaxID=3155647 RepID=UPI0033E10C8D
MSVGDVSGLLGVLVTVLLAALPPIRPLLVRLGRRIRFAIGGPERRYAAWFLREHGRYDNPYLERVEDLDLRRTFVSLYLRGADGGPDVRQPAADVVARRLVNAVGAQRHMLIEGDPGSGKSTLLKALGVASLRGRTGVAIDAIQVRQPEVPFFVPLRKLGEHLSGGGGIDGYVIDEILVKSVGMRSDLAQLFFRRTLDTQQCLVLLDGLDEVTAQHYRPVLNEVHRFMDNRSPDAPTAQARMVITCRRQNLLTIQDEWVGPIAEHSYRLAPFRNGEIYNYLDNVRKAMRPRGPEDFMVALRSSRTLELHRTPLVLAMSVGIFAKKDYYEIPHSISELYRRMISEMLDRHRFKDDPLGSANRFRVRDKYTFLRLFAHRAALGVGGFDEFTRRALVRVAAEVAESLEAVPTERVEEFVDEVAERSGLLSPLDGQRYVFAHRSIQEHLVAEELLRLGDAGERTMIERSADGDWRQVVLFYAAAADQSRLTGFLAELTPRNLALAGQCLSGADAPDAVAATILSGLAGKVRARQAVAVNLSALLAATSSPRLVVQRAAIETACDVLNGLIAKRAEVVNALGGDLDAVGRVLNTVADANSTRVAGLLPALVAVVPDDPALVEPLWRCLATEGIEEDPARFAIIERLVTLVMDSDCLAELQGLDPHTRPFITPQLRDKVYPFAKGHSKRSNLVTLLAWVDHLNVTISQPNRYLEAAAAGPKVLAGVERSARRLGLDSSRRAVVPRTWYVAFVLYLATVAAATSVLVADESRLLQPYGRWNLAVVAIPVVLSLLLRFRVSAARSFGPRRLSSGIYASTSAGAGVLIQFRAQRPLSDGPLRGLWYVLTRLRVLVLFDIILAAPSAVAFAPLIDRTLAGYLALSTAVIVVIQELPGRHRIERAARGYWSVPQFADVYRDERSRAWVVPSAVVRLPSRYRPGTGLTVEYRPREESAATEVVGLTVSYSRPPTPRTARHDSDDATIILPLVSWKRSGDPPSPTA